jgi:hypothetical protein
MIKSTNDTVYISLEWEICQFVLYNGCFLKGDGRLTGKKTAEWSDDTGLMIFKNIL